MGEGKEINIVLKFDSIEDKYIKFVGLYNERIITMLRAYKELEPSHLLKIDKSLLEAFKMVNKEEFAKRLKSFKGSRRNDRNRIVDLTIKFN